MEQDNRFNQIDTSKNKGTYSTYVKPSKTNDVPPIEETKTPIDEPISLGGQHTTFGNYGWICPVCGRGLSPFTSFCPCKPFTPQITWTTQPWVYNPGPTCTYRTTAI